MTRIFFTRQGLKVVSVAFACVILGLMLVVGFIGAIAFPAVAANTVNEADMNWLGEIVSLLLMIPGATVLTAYLILEDQKKKTEREERLARRTDQSLSRYPRA